MVINHEDILATEPYVVVANLSQYNHQLQVRLAAPVDFSETLPRIGNV